MCLYYIQCGTNTKFKVFLDRLLLNIPAWQKYVIIQQAKRIVKQLEPLTDNCFLHQAVNHLLNSTKTLWNKLCL